MFTEEESILSRPDAMILGYAATRLDIIFDEQFNHNLYGNDPKIGTYLNTVDYVSEKTPPTFLWHTAEDDVVDAACSLEFAEKLIRSKVPMELHIFPKGVHGLSVATADVDDPENGRFADPHVAEWVSLSIQWLSTV